MFSDYFLLGMAPRDTIIVYVGVIPFLTTTVPIPETSLGQEIDPLIIALMVATFRKIGTRVVPSNVFFPIYGKSKMIGDLSRNHRSPWVFIP